MDFFNTVSDQDDLYNYMRTDVSNETIPSSACDRTKFEGKDFFLVHPSSTLHFVLNPGGKKQVCEVTLTDQCCMGWGQKM